MYKIFLAKLIFLSTLILLFQLFLTRMFPNQLKAQSEKDWQYLKEFKETKADVLILGDSVYFSTSPDEQSKTSLIQIIEQRNIDKSFLPILRPAMHSGLYPEFIKAKMQSANKPRFVVMPINLRSFSYMWDMRPEFLLEDEKINIQYINNEIYRSFARPMKVFKFSGFFDVRQDQYENLPVIINGQNIGKVKSLYTQENKHNLKNIWGFLYMYDLTSNHRKIQSLINAVRLLNQNNIKAVVYITPIDYQSASESWSGDFKDAVLNNTRVIKTELNKYGIEILDLTFALPKEAFDWKRDDYPDEHLLFSGRDYVASELTKMLK